MNSCRRIKTALHLVITAMFCDLPQGALISMHTPAVLTFLHLVTALLMQLALVSNNVISPPHISTAAAKGALVPATLNALQVRFPPSSWWCHAAG